MLVAVTINQYAFGMFYQAAVSIYYQAIPTESGLWPSALMEILLPLEAMTKLFVSGMLLQDNVYKTFKGSPIGYGLLHFTHQIKLLWLVVMMIKKCVFGMFYQAAVSIYYQVIPTESGLWPSALMEILLPLEARIKLFAFGTYHPSIVSIYYQAIPTESGL
ncbi:hypothetical protein KDAU_68480 [Dictyobacter aurantiacus]|uniref:Uncharacterized protein n=1 Tax=Dictyobacter aurantiacus TaxID=1936993 RepID=A0A401ZRL3_9CHLR|nr:hypothetical protein KDAU_68480 [Dictyobacter aurantiacus]